jgi:hypothetical protein
MSNIIIITIAVIFLSFSGLFQVITNTTLKVATFFWQLLTPGQELLEIMALTVGVILGISFVVIMNDITNKIDAKIRMLKEETKQKSDRIERLEYEIILLKSAFIQNQTKIFNNK